MLSTGIVSVPLTASPTQPAPTRRRRRVPPCCPTGVPMLINQRCSVIAGGLYPVMSGSQRCLPAACQSARPPSPEETASDTIVDRLSIPPGERAVVLKQTGPLVGAGG